MYYSVKLLLKSVCVASFMSACAPVIAKFVAKGNSTNKRKNMCEQPSINTHTQINTFCPLRVEKTGEKRKLPPPTLITH